MKAFQTKIGRLNMGGGRILKLKLNEKAIIIGSEVQTLPFIILFPLKLMF